MDQIKRKNVLLVFLFLSAFLIVLTPIVFFLAPIVIEDYCFAQAVKKIGGQQNWAEMLPANESEKKFVSDQITRGFREQLKCESRWGMRF